MVENPGVVEVNNGMPVWLVPAVVILAIVSTAGLGFAWYDYSNQMQTAQQASGQVKTTQQNNAQLFAALQQKQAQADATNEELRSNLGVVTKRLGLTQTELKKAQDEAAQIRLQQDTQNELKLAQMDTDIQKQLATKASTDDLNTDLNSVNGNVNGVKTDLEGTKNDLKMARSELGTLIARNHDEIDVLRRMGERDYVEFTVQGRNKPQRIGVITAELRAVNTKKNQFTIALTVDDVRTVKSNRTVNEPIIFYQHGSHQADEFVVNQVGKDKVSGYISAPKNAGTTTTASGN
jgi:hypothetical protein